MRVSAYISRRVIRPWRRRIVQKKTRRRLLVFILVVLSLGMASRLYDSSSIDPAAYSPLLNTIAKGESGGNYNAYFGNADNQAIRFTDMSVGEVLAWQAGYVEQGSVSNAVGKYQIIRPTLLDLINHLNIDQSATFDEALQDRLAIALLERRGVVDYVNSNLTRDQFAANLAMEWAALPKSTGDNPHESYYASDGINKSHITMDEMYTALGVVLDLARKE